MNLTKTQLRPETWLGHRSSYCNIDLLASAAEASTPDGNMKTICPPPAVCSSSIMFLMSLQYILCTHSIAVIVSRSTTQHFLRPDKMLVTLLMLLHLQLT